MAVLFVPSKIQVAEKEGKKNAIGRSRGGCSTKIHALTDTNGKPLEIRITQGQVHDSVMAIELIDFYSW